MTAILFELTVVFVLLSYSSIFTGIFLDAVKFYDPRLKMDSANKFIDDLQNGDGCCAWNGPSDYYENLNLNRNRSALHDLPITCCQNESQLCNTESSDLRKGCAIYSQGQSTTLSVLLTAAVLVKIVAITINVLVTRNEEKKFRDDNSKLSHNYTVKHIVV